MFWLSDVLTGTDSVRLMRRTEAPADAPRTRVTRRTLAAVARTFKTVSITATRGLASRLRAFNERQKLVHTLSNMEDRQLADIGLTSNDVTLIARGDWPVRSTDKSERQTTRAVMAARERDSAKDGDDCHEPECRQAA